MSMSLDYADIFRESWDIGRMGVMWNYLSQTYVTALERAGAVPVAIPMVDDPSILIPFIDSLDGFLLTGGNDIDPMCYSEVDRGRCGRIVREREEQELLLVRHILEKTDKPLLAICRGQQLLNVALGGSLIQDLEAEGFRSHSRGNHAMDAVVVAVTTDGMIQKITRYTQRRENDCNPIGTYTDPATGEVLSRDEYDQKYGKQFPEPWPGFRQELLARLSPNPDKEVRALRLPNYDSDEKIRPVFVSRMPRRKVTGAAHEATIRSPRPEQRVVTKTPLQKLKLDKDGEIADYYNWQDDILLYEAVKARLTAYKGDGEKAFQEDFYKPKRDGSKGPLVKKVKTYAKSSSNVVTCGGVAKNGDMIRIDVYHVPEDGYYLIPIYTADVVRGVLPQKAVVAHVAPSDWKEMQEIHFIFSLYPGDLIGISAKKEINLKRRNADGTGEPELKRKEWMLYYTSANIAIGAITVTTHDRKYEKSSLGIKTLLTIEKYEVDPLGNYHKVKVPEKRQTF